MILLLGMCYSSCKKDVILIKPGCLPSERWQSAAIFPELTNYYNYNDGMMISNDVFGFKYDKTKLVETSLYDDRYEQFFYNSEGFVIESKQYGKGLFEDNFELVAHYNFSYEKGELVRSYDVINKETFYYYCNGDGNIDSLITQDDQSKTIISEYFEYDNNPNIYSNVCHPLFNYFWRIKNRSNNNVTYYRKEEPTAPQKIFIVTSDYEYNTFGYPTTIYNDYSSGIQDTLRYEYINCQ